MIKKFEEMGWLDRIFGKELEPSGLAKSKINPNKFDYSKLSKEEIDKLGPQQPVPISKKIEETFDVDEIAKSLNDLSKDEKFSENIVEITTDKGKNCVLVGLSIPIEDSIKEFPLSKYVDGVGFMISSKDDVNNEVSIQVLTNIDISRIINANRVDCSYKKFQIHSHLILGKILYSKKHKIESLLDDCISNITELFRKITSMYVNNLINERIVELSNQYQSRRNEAYEEFKNNFEWVQDCLIHIEDMD